MAKVIVLGSINQDIVATAPRHPVPGETVAGNTLNYFPGGKGANQAVAAACAGAETIILGRVGSDSFGIPLRDFLAEKKVDTNSVRIVDGESTGAALIVVNEQGENSIVVVAGANSHAKDDLSIEFAGGDVLVSQFEVPVDSIIDFFRRGKESGSTTVLNPAPISEIPIELADLIDSCVLNETELASLCGADVNTESEYEIVKAVRNSVLSACQNVVVTLGVNGVVVLGGEATRVAAHKVSVVDSTGAGDCFVGSLAARLSTGDSMLDAISYANKAASICVTRHGAGPSMPLLEEVRSAFAND